MAKSYVEVDDPTSALFLEMKNYLAQFDVPLVIGFQKKVDDLWEFCKTNDITKVNLENPLVYAGHGEHWTPAGHSYVADELFFSLKNKGILE